VVKYRRAVAVHLQY